jgi:hypothetical protein
VHFDQVLGLEQAAGADEVSRQLVLTHVIDPTAKRAPLGVLEETAIERLIRDGQAAARPCPATAKTPATSSTGKAVARTNVSHVGSRRQRPVCRRPTPHLRSTGPRRAVP